MWEEGQLSERPVREVAHEVVGDIVDRLASRYDVTCLLVHHEHRALVVRRLRAEQPGRLTVVRVERIEERPVALRRRPVADEEDGVGVIGGQKDAAPVLVPHHHGLAWVVVSVLPGVVHQELRLYLGRTGLDLPRPYPAIVPPPLTGDGQSVVAPVDAVVAQFECHPRRRLSIERGGQQEEPVPLRGRSTRVASVQRLRPAERGRGIGPPHHAAWTGLHTPARYRYLLPERMVGHRVHDLSPKIPDLNQKRETVGGHRVRVGSVQRLDEDVASVRRRIEVPRDGGVANCRHRAVQFDQRELGREVQLEERLVVRVLEQVLIRTGGRLRADVLLNNGTLGNTRSLERRPAAPLGVDQTADQGLAVVEPRGRLPRRQAYDGTGERSRFTRLRLGHPQLHTLRGRVRERHAGAARRPPHVRDAGNLRQAGDRSRLEISDPDELEPVVRPHAARREAVGLDSEPRELELGLCQLRYRRVARPRYQDAPFSGRAYAELGRLRCVDDVDQRLVRHAVRCGLGRVCTGRARRQTGHNRQ